MKIIVTENQERLDKYLANNTEHSRSTIIKMLDNGFIKVNGKIEKSSYLVKMDDERLYTELLRQYNDWLNNK